MAKGDLLRLANNGLRYAKIKAAETPVAGDPIIIDLNGEIVKATQANARTDGPAYYLTNQVNKDDNAFKGYLIDGDIVATMGAVVKPRQEVAVNASSKLIAAVKTVTSTYVQAEIQDGIYNRAGIYLHREGQTDLTATDAADTVLGVIRVGRGA